MVAKALLDRLRCLHTGSSLTPASAELIGVINDAIDRAELFDLGGRRVERHVAEGLANDDQSVFYVILDGVLQMMRDEAFDLKKMRDQKHG